MISVLIAEDHPLYRDGLVLAVERHPELNLAGAVGDGKAALDQAQSGDIDVVLLDLMLPYMSGLEVLTELKRAGSPIRSIVLSATTDPEVVHRAIRAGADGYVLKDAARDEICSKLLEVARGSRVLSQSLQDGLLRQVALGAVRDQCRLSARERQVLQLISGGRTNREIAEELVLSLGSVKTYVNRICHKLEASGRTSAAAIALRAGLLD